MITGGSNSTLQSGNIRSGYSDLFLPCTVSLLPSSIISDYNNSVGIPYTFAVYIKNDADWVFLADVVSFSISINPSGNFNTASLQVKNTLEWGISGTSHTDLLKPGNSKIKITGSCTGVTDFAFFIGRLSQYNRSEAFGSATISLEATDVRTILQRKAGISYADNQTPHRSIKRQIQADLKALGVTHSTQVADGSGVFPSTGSEYSTVNSAVNGQSFWVVTSSGNLIIQSAHTTIDVGDISGDMIELTDSNIISLARIDNEFATFNTYKTAGFVGDVYTTSQVENAADVAIRGNVYYPAGYIGTPAAQLSESNEVAQYALDMIFNPAFNATVPFFPFFEAGMTVKIQSDRFNLAQSITKIGTVTHTYQHGSSSTSLDGLYTEVV